MGYDMGFLDNIKGAVQERLHPQDSRDDYYDDYDDADYGDYDESYDEGAAEPEGRHARREPERRTGLLGNPARPEADSVSVYTRSGRRVSNEEAAGSADTGATYQESAYRADSAYRAADDDWRASADAPREFNPTPADATGSYVPAITQPGVFGATGNTPGDVGLTAVPRVTSGKLPAYVLKPTSYDDVQMVVRRVRTNQPVVLSFKNLKIEVAKRILDFSFGLACGVDGAVEELGDRVFVVLPHGVELADADRQKLQKDGLLR